MDLEMYIHQWYKGVKIQKDSNIADMVANDTYEYFDCLDYMECEECPYYYADED